MNKITNAHPAMTCLKKANDDLHRLGLMYKDKYGDVNIADPKTEHELICSVLQALVNSVSAAIDEIK